MLQANPALSPARIGALLAQTGKPLKDPKNGNAFPRIDALAAVRAAVCDGEADGKPCDDGDACTSGDACAGGVCQGTAVADGTPCDDGDACTSQDRCTAGACAGQAPSPARRRLARSTASAKPETAACTSVHAAPLVRRAELHGRYVLHHGHLQERGVPGRSTDHLLAAARLPDHELQPGHGGLRSRSAPDGTAYPGGSRKTGACVPTTSTTTTTGTGGGTSLGPPSTTQGGCGCAVPARSPWSGEAYVALALLYVARLRGGARRAWRACRPRSWRGRIGAPQQGGVTPPV